MSRAYVERFAARARDAGIGHLGISEHLYRFRQAAGLIENDYVLARQLDDLEVYFEVLTAAREEGLIQAIGVEADYRPESLERTAALLERYPFDYVIGSVHWLGDFAVDLKEQAHRYLELGVDRVYEDYYAALAAAAASGVFDLLGHLDLPKIWGHRLSPGAGRLHLGVVQIAAERGLVVEFSTAGWRRPVGEHYPANQVLEDLVAAGVLLTISSDAHAPAEVGYRYWDAYAALRALGVREVAALTGRKVRMVALPGSTTPYLDPPPGEQPGGG